MDTDELLRTDFDGNYVPNPYNVIHAGVGDPRHSERVPELARILADGAVSESDRFLACYALTAWAEPAGYAAVIEAAAGGKEIPWYDTLIDRTYSVDNTFAHLAAAISDGEHLAQRKGTDGQRTEAVRALVGIADAEYFDGKLEYVLDNETVTVIIEDIKAVVRRGTRLLREGERPKFDLATQLVDLAASASTIDASTAVDLATQVIATQSHYRAMNHAIAIVYRVKGDEGHAFGEYLKTVGDERIRKQVDDVIKSR